MYFCLNCIIFSNVHFVGLCYVFPDRSSDLSSCWNFYNRMVKSSHRNLSCLVLWRPSCFVRASSFHFPPVFLGKFLFFVSFLASLIPIFLFLDPSYITWRPAGFKEKLTLIWDNQTLSFGNGSLNRTHEISRTYSEFHKRQNELVLFPRWICFSLFCRMFKMLWWGKRRQWR